VHWASSLLFLASWACNEYLPKFAGQYVNSTSFRVVGQRYSGPEPHFIGLRSRRRDGSTWDGGYQHGDGLFTLPPQCSLRASVSVDADFLAALDKADAAKTVTVARLRSALSFVSLANTDDDHMDERAEVILMGSAFEKLMGGNERAYKLAKLFGALFKKRGTVTVAEAISARPGITIDSSDPARAQAQPGWWIHQKWIEELHQLRSQAVHKGHTDKSRNWGWRVSEHLLMAAHVFPLAVKELLAREGHYVLSSRDIALCTATDTLLSNTEWDQDTGDGPRWSQIVSAAIDQLRFERALANVQASHSAPA